MAVESDSDRLAFLSVDEFGIEVTLDPDSTARKINAIFDAGHVEIANGITFVSTVQPVLLCRTSDVVSVGQGSIVEAGGLRYAVADIMPDGTGMTELRIHKLT